MNKSSVSNLSIWDRKIRFTISEKLTRLEEEGKVSAPKELAAAIEQLRKLKYLPDGTPLCWPEANVPENHL